MNLSDYDLVVLNSSGGKDSQAMTIEVMRQIQALPRELRPKVIMVHADLSRVEWRDAKETARLHAEHYGIPFLVAKRRQNDLLEHIEARGMFPDNKNRYCTSDHKRDPCAVVVRRQSDLLPAALYRRPRVLTCMGMRAQESPARAKLVPLRPDKRLTNSKRVVTIWLPIHEWKVEEVWRTIRESGLPYHWAYDLGMPRLSCCFCIFAPREALLTAGYHNRGLLAEYVRVERQIGHTFRKDLTLAGIERDLEAGWSPGGTIADWKM